jgi:hypothetical protein
MLTNIIEALKPEEYNGNMDHMLGDSSTYIRLYSTDYNEMDYQAIVFGSEP